MDWLNICLKNMTNLLWLSPAKANDAKYDLFCSLLPNDNFNWNCTGLEREAKWREMQAEPAQTTSSAPRTFSGWSTTWSRPSSPSGSRRYPRTSKSWRWFRGATASRKTSTETTLRKQPTTTSSRDQFLSNLFVLTDICEILLVNSLWSVIEDI